MLSDYKYIRTYIDASGVRKILKLGPPGNKTEYIADWVGTKTFAKGFSPEQSKKFAEWFFKKIQPDVDVMKTIGEHEDFLSELSPVGTADGAHVPT